MKKTYIVFDFQGVIAKYDCMDTAIEMALINTEEEKIPTNVFDLDAGTIVFTAIA